MAAQNVYTTKQLKQKNYQLRKMYADNKAFFKKTKDLEKQLLDNNDELLQAFEKNFQEKEKCAKKEKEWKAKTSFTRKPNNQFANNFQQVDTSQ